VNKCESQYYGFDMQLDGNEVRVDIWNPDIEERTVIPYKRSEFCKVAGDKVLSWLNKAIDNRISLFLSFKADERIEEDKSSFEDEFQYILEFAKKEDFFFAATQKQLKSLWTAICLHNNYECDTAAYDIRILRIWEVLSKNKSCPWKNDEEEGIGGFDLFDNFMCEDIV